MFIQSVPRSKHTPFSVIKASKLMLYMGIIIGWDTYKIEQWIVQNMEFLNAESSDK
jgi:hypothetical protein